MQQGGRRFGGRIPLHLLQFRVSLRPFDTRHGKSFIPKPKPSINKTASLDKNLFKLLQNRDKNLCFSAKNWGYSRLIYDKDVQLQANEAVQMNEKMFPYCCFNSSHTIRFYGNNCDNLQFRYLDSICKFSNYFLEGSCDHHGIKSEAQMCTVHGLNCVLQRTFLMPCSGTKPLETCLIDKFSCL